MIQRFECWNCGKHFSADDNEQIKCPYCQSDNVEYASWHLPRWTAKVSLACCAIAVICYAVSKIDFSASPIDNDDEKEPEINSDTIEVEQEGIDINIPISIIAANPVLTEDGDYSFEAKVSNLPVGKYEFVLLEKFEDKVIARSNNGKFSNIPYSKANNAGTYRVQVRAKANDSICAETDVPGFIKQVRVAEKMTISELQTKIEARDESLMGIGENDYLAPDYTIKFQGLSKGSTVPKILAEVFEKLDNGTWESATVTTLEYDDLNRISAITIKVHVANLDF